MTAAAAEPPALQPPAYLERLVEYFQTEDPAVWRWFAEHRARAEDLESTRLDLLKSAYRIEPVEQPPLFEAARQAARSLGVEVPISLYQAQSGEEMNASLAYIPGEVHLVLHGPVTKTLDAAELLALFGHELAHFSLLDGWEGRFGVCHDLLRALSVDEQADPASLASWRLFSLHCEIHCDRGALTACGDLRSAVGALVKLETGSADARAETFLKQATEIVASGAIRSEGATHPESYLRAQALRLWAEQGAAADASIREMLHGPTSLARLDLLAQREVAGWTRRLVDRLLAPEWFQTEPVLAHARLYFEDYAPPGARREDATLAADLATDDEQLRDYYCYVLLDFVTADTTLDEHPLAAALLVARELGLEAWFAALATKELRLRKKQIEDTQKQAEALVKTAK